MNSTDIANAALALVCEQRVSSISDDSEHGRRVRDALPLVVREVLSEFPWRCARRRVSLSQLSAPPDFGWRFQYQLPADFLRLVSLNGDNVNGFDVTQFCVEGDRLLTHASRADAVYIFDVTGDRTGNGFSNLDALCAEAIYTKLAARLSFGFTQNSRREQELGAVYERVLAKAKSKSTRDAFEHTVPFWHQESVGQARVGGALYVRADAPPRAPKPSPPPEEPEPPPPPPDPVARTLHLLSPVSRVHPGSYIAYVVRIGITIPHDCAFSVTAKMNWVAPGSVLKITSCSYAAAFDVDWNQDGSEPLVGAYIWPSYGASEASAEGEISAGTHFMDFTFFDADNHNNYTGGAMTQGEFWLTLSDGFEVLSVDYTRGETNKPELNAEAGNLPHTAPWVVNEFEGEEQ